MIVRVVGNYFGSSGYAAHVRGLCKGLSSNGVELAVTSPLPSLWEKHVSTEEMRWLRKEPNKEETVIHVGTPPSWRFVLAGRPKRFIGFLVWEGSHIPRAWLDYINHERVEQVWVPSKHVADAINATANKYSILVKPSVSVVPHGFDPAVFHPLRKPSDRPFTFMASKGWVHPTEDRGGLQYALKAFNEEFGAEENVRFIVKVNPAYLQGSEQDGWIASMLAAAGVTEKKAPILVTLSDMPEDGLSSFYADGDVFVCSTRCEGFNLPGLEAHACGLPTIQTSYGGQVDYMSPDSDWFVGYTLAPVVHDVMYEEALWATPDIADLRRCMREAFSNRSLVSKKSAAALKSVSSWTWADTGLKAKELLGK
jgi:glycosyltransferase involved in cell wall biosynthesis